MPTKRETEFWMQVTRRTHQLQPDMNRAVLAMLRDIRAYLTDDAVAEVVRSGSVDETINTLLSDARLTAAGNRVRLALLTTLLSGGTFALDRIPRSAGRRPTFNVLGPQLVETLRTLDQKMMAVFRSELVAVIRNELTAIMQAGVPARTAGARVRATVGLTPRQAQEVARFRVTRATMPTTRGVMLSETQVERMTQAYRDRRIAINTDVITRTATSDAFKAGQFLAMTQVVAAGILLSGSLVKTWVNMGDGRVRDEHSNRGGMGGQTVPWNNRYSNGDMIPGESTWNCRCVSYYSILSSL